MRKSRVEPNSGTYNALLDAALVDDNDKGRAASKAMEMFEDMPAALRNQHSYACAIKLAAVLGRGGEVPS
jgi:hypothetical protein